MAFGIGSALKGVRKKLAKGSLAMRLHDKKKEKLFGRGRKNRDAAINNVAMREQREREERFRLRDEKKNRALQAVRRHGGFG